MDLQHTEQWDLSLPALDQWQSEGWEVKLHTLTDLTLSASETSVEAGDPITFSGIADDDGEPVAGATVEILSGYETVATTETDADGAYSVTGALDTGTHSIRSQIAGIAGKVMSEGWGIVTPNIDLQHTEHW